MNIEEVIEARDKALANYEAAHAINVQLRQERDELKAHNEMLVEALEQLARLGNGNHYGNSVGNSIAIEALYKIKSTTSLTEITLRNRKAKALDEAFAVLESVEELNMSNYDHELVRKMNDGFCEAYLIMKLAIEQAMKEQTK